MVADRDPTGLTLAVQKSFGNCPQYIQTRMVRAQEREPQPAEVLPGLDETARERIARSDTFFATASPSSIETAGGLDMSHRGGRPGFVRIDGQTLTIPDFRGNRAYNTFGNILGEPRASLLFIDFEAGDLLQLQGRAVIDWEPPATIRATGAERARRCDVTRG